ncbi:methionine synthase [Granulicoccus sp. GXG6511]|uniref:methionine synthase n=1 Tax=Granulicoccus sp. GXG6511 TaxID=3381351 RepID=UPI003D7E2EF9
MKVGVTGIGSWPGEDFAAAQRLLFGELGDAPDVPHMAELPSRGIGSDMIGRAAALIDEFGLDLQPAGWRVTDAAGIDHRRAKARWREDLDLLEETAQGYAGAFKLAVTGPWTLAAMIERPRGDRMLADHGARRDLAGALAEGIAATLAELQRRLPDLSLTLQLDEPLLPRVGAGRIRTASGFSRFRSVELPELSGTLTSVVETARSAYEGTLTTALHCCAAGLDPELVLRAGFDAVSLPGEFLDTDTLDRLGPGIEAGHALWLGIAPTHVLDQPLRPDRLAERALAILRPLELGSAWAGRLVLTPACGLAGWTQRPAVAVLRNLREAAAIVGDELAR